MRLDRTAFCGFSMGSNQYCAGRVYGCCVYFMMQAPEGSTKSGFMKKPGIKPATPGLQGIGLSPTPQRLLSIRYNRVICLVHPANNLIFSKIEIQLLKHNCF